MKKKNKLGRYEKGIIITGAAVLIIFLILLTADGIKNINSIEKISEYSQYQYTTKIGNKEYSIDNAVTETPNVPDISAGMIPIKWNGTNWEIAENNSNWYNYEEGKPAYIMLNDGLYQSELLADMSNKKLAYENIGQKIEETELGSIYMWIPRFAYNKMGEIIYIKQGYTVAGSWTIPSMFIYETEEIDYSLSGVWVEYNTLNTSKVNSMNQEENVYGFIANTKAKSITQGEKEDVQKYIEILIKSIEDVPETINLINNVANTNRTILQIINSNKRELIKVNAYYDVTEEKIKVEVKYSINGVSKILDKDGNVLSENSLIGDTADMQLGNGTYRFIVIDKQGMQKGISVKITTLDKYIIKDEETLYEFRDDVNARLTKSTTKAYQIADISINEGLYTKNEETGECTFLDEAKQWEPIGNSPFAIYEGTYYGQGHTISGLYINDKTKYPAALFGYLSGTVQDLGIIDTTFIGSYYTSGLVSMFTGEKIENCYSYATINGRRYCGGIAGEISIVDNNKEAIINNCYNKGSVIGTEWENGGIVGHVYTANGSSIKITNCYNTGEVTGKDAVGGIVGFVGTSSATIKNCYNTGKVNGTGDYSSNTTAHYWGKGGIVGGSYGYNPSIMYCYNSGEITGTGRNNIGGISGYNGNISYCYNIGNISGRNSIGGITGFSRAGETSYCYNIGAITGNGSCIGGIAGLHTDGSIQNTYNTGDVTGESEVGGIAGRGGSIMYSYNLGSNVVGSSTEAGGIAGMIYDNVAYCYNVSNVSGRQYIGGIIGRAHYSESVTYAYNLGEVEGSGNYYVGGIVGGASAKSLLIKYSINVGNINSKGTYVGSIIGSQYDTSSGTGLTSCGYLSGTAEYAVGSAKLNTGATAYSTLSRAPTVISRLGTAYYKTNTSINAKYPVLKWQTTNDKLDLINKENAFKQLADGSIVLAYQ